MTANRRQTKLPRARAQRDDGADQLPLSVLEPAHAADEDVGQVDWEALTEKAARGELSAEDHAMAGRFLVGPLLHELSPMLRDTTPLRSELLVSTVLGVFLRRLARDVTNVEDPVAAILRALATVGGDTGLAFLRVLETLCETPEHRELARQSTHQVAARGAKAARWSNHLGAVRLEACWGLTDAFGDQMSLLCVFAYGEHRHGLMALVDFSYPGGWVKDLYPVFGDDLPTVEHELNRATAAGDGLMTLAPVEPARARRLLESGIALADQLNESELDDSSADPSEFDDEGGSEVEEWAGDMLGLEGDGDDLDVFTSTRVLALARARILPPGADPEPVDPDAASLQTEAGRKVVVERFLAAPQARGLPDDDVSRRLVDLLLQAVCLTQPAWPLRVSPTKTAGFLLGFVPQQVELSAADRDRLPAVVTSWTRWRAEEEGLPPAACAELDTAVHQITAEFRGELSPEYQLPDLSELLGGQLDQLLEDFIGESAFQSERELPEVEGDPDAVYVVKVSLAYAKPPIWRRLRVPSDVSLAQLHRVVQQAFGWQDSHLHRFELPGREPAESPRELGGESTRRLYQLLVQPKDRLDYRYDFGDDWEHQIVLEKVEPADGVRHAVCVAGRRAAPLEDGGGIPGSAFDKEELNQRMRSVSLRRRKK